MLRRLRTQAVWIGQVLSVVALTAVAAWFVRMRVWRTVDLRDPRLYAMVSVCVAIYVAGFAFFGYGWVRWLELSAAIPFPTATGIRIHCRSQIAKYVPGNVFQFVARHASANRLGATHSALVLAAAAEIAALVVAAVTLAASGRRLPAPFPQIPRAAAFGVALLAVILAVTLASKLSGAVDRGRRARLRRWLGACLTLLLYVPPFVGNGLCLALLLSLNHTGALPPLTALVGIWSMSWLAGYLVPGSPGGLGVRDAALVLALSGWCSRTEAVAIATEMRLVSTLGDVTLWLASLERAAPPVVAARIYKTLT